MGFNIIWIPINEDLAKNEINYKELANSICIFDDIDVLPNIEIKEEIKEEMKSGKIKIKEKIKKIDMSDSMRKLRDKILQEGWKLGISAICMSHQLNNYGKTRDLSLEADFVVVFKGTGTYHIS